MRTVTEEAGIRAVSPEKVVMKMIEALLNFLMAGETEGRPEVSLLMAPGAFSFRVR